MATSYRICREILQSATEVTPLKLIKLAYLTHGYHLGYLDAPAFNDEVEAWRYGPVVRDIYFAVRHFRNGEIKQDLFDHIDDPINANTRQIIEAVVKTYDVYNGMQLSTITHKEGTPWDITIKDKGIYQVIPDSLIRQHYKKIIARGNATAA